MNKKILYKLLLIFAFALIFMSFSVFSVFAQDFGVDNIPPFNADYDAYDSKYLIYTYGSTGNIYLCHVYSTSSTAVDIPTKFSLNDNNNIYIMNMSNSTLYFRQYKLVDGVWSSVSSEAESILKDYSKVINLGGQIPTFYYSTLDVTQNGEVVFQQPPQVQEQVTTLAPIVEEMETEKTLAEIVAILPVVLVVIVGLLAMRKAIKFLMKTLKQG